MKGKSTRADVVAVISYSVVVGTSVAVVGTSVVVVGKSVMMEVGNSVMVVGNSVGTEILRGQSTNGALVALKLGRSVVSVLVESGAGTEFVNNAVVKGRSTGDAVGGGGRAEIAFATISGSILADDRSNRPSIPSTVKAAPATTILPPTTTMAVFVGRTRTKHSSGDSGGDANDNILPTIAGDDRWASRSNCDWEGEKKK